MTSTLCTPHLPPAILPVSSARDIEMGCLPSEASSFIVMQPLVDETHRASVRRQAVLRKKLVWAVTPALAGTSLIHGIFAASMYALEEPKPFAGFAALGSVTAAAAVGAWTYGRRLPFQSVGWSPQYCASGKWALTASLGLATGIAWATGAPSEVTEVYLVCTGLYAGLGAVMQSFGLYRDHWPG